MGADTFIVHSEGKTAQAAFDAAVSRAQYDHGHAGYTGTIAEKYEFQMVPPPANLADMNMREVEDYIYGLFRFDNEPKDRPFWDDKWGPAAGMKVGEEDYYFFGWASS